MISAEEQLELSVVPSNLPVKADDEVLVRIEAMPWRLLGVL